jgi:hypothetical protein
MYTPTEKNKVFLVTKLELLSKGLAEYRMFQLLYNDANMTMD